uniref:F-box domain-containing protein n=1 Tax=Caenorhabditis tropicalis TaxID=1561998 RepID=A0A1I7UK15_9PELO
MVSPSFRLFQLPQVALKEMLKLIDLNELFILSLCSRRSSQYVKLYYNKSLKWWMALYTYKPSPPEVRNGQAGSYQTIVVVKESTELQYTENVTVGDHTVPFVKTPESCELYWDDQRVGLKIVVEYICELFNSFPSSLVTQLPFLWMIELMNNPISITHVETFHPNWDDGLPLREEECKYLITTCKSCVFILNIIFPEGFIYTGPFGKHELFVISHGSWITVDNLISMGETCIEINIRESKLTVADLNSFMKSWFNYKANTFRLIQITDKILDIPAIFDGLEDAMVTVEGTMVYDNQEESVELSKYVSLEFPAGHSVLRRDDGMIAAAALSDFGLFIAIWPDIGSIRENEIGKYKLNPIVNV